MRNRLPASILQHLPPSRADLDCLLSNPVGCLISVLVWVHPVSSMPSLVTHTTPSRLCLMGVDLPRMDHLPSEANYSRWRGYGLEPSCWLSLPALRFLSQFWALLIAVSCCPLSILTCCTFPNVKPKLISGLCLPWLYQTWISAASSPSRITWF